MLVTEILTAIAGFSPLFQPLLEWQIKQGQNRTAKKADIAKTFTAYRAEVKLNHAILQKINLEKINTKDISNPAMAGIASRLKTEQSEKLLLALLAEIQTPKKAVKILPTAAKVDTAEAKKFIKTIIVVMEKIRELQCFTALTEAEQKILKGFYVKGRLKHIQEKTRYITQHL